VQGNPRISCEELAVGESREQVVVESLTRTQIVQYAGASGDFNPIHHDEVFATQAAGYPSVFAHGMLSMGLSGRLLTDWLGDGVLRSYGVRFVRQVWPGDTLTARGTVRSIEAGAGEGVVEIELVTRNQKGEPVVTGSASAALPLRRAPRG
jgi:acyl dehydratase